MLIFNVLRECPNEEILNVACLSHARKAQCRDNAAYNIHLGELLLEEYCGCYCAEKENTCIVEGVYYGLVYTLKSYNERVDRQSGYCRSEKKECERELGLLECLECILLFLNEELHKRDECRTYEGDNYHLLLFGRAYKASACIEGTCEVLLQYEKYTVKTVCKSEESTDDEEEETVLFLLLLVFYLLLLGGDHKYRGEDNEDSGELNQRERLGVRYPGYQSGDYDTAGKAEGHEDGIGAGAGCLDDEGVVAVKHNCVAKTEK